VEIIIPVIGNAPGEKEFIYNGANPGVGGTEFVSIMLAIELARYNKKFNIHLIGEVVFKIKEKPLNLIQTVSDLENPNVIEILNDKIYILIAPSSLLEIWSRINYFPGCKVVNWIHHPFYYDMYKLARKCYATVSVGAYQYFSNQKWYNAHWYIPNLFVSYKKISGYDKIKVDKKNLRLVYLGALTKSKGFSVIMRQWRSIKEAYPQVRLDVIGSSQTYSGKIPEHPIIPATKSYGDEIMSYLCIDDIKEKKIIFHGNLGKEKNIIIEKAHIAILNPTGKTEAYPASPLECMSFNTPVIAACDFGLTDVMQFFPELSLRSPSDIVPKINWILESDLRYQEFSERAGVVAEFIYNQNPQISLRWAQLLTKINKQTTVDVSLSNPPFVLSEECVNKRFIARKLRSIIVYYMKKILENIKR
jgi:glycosyltransferase involved in cell wall biosynthesis